MDHLSSHQFIRVHSCTSYTLYTCL